MRGSQIFWLSIAIVVYILWVYLLCERAISATNRFEKNNIYIGILVSVVIPWVIWEILAHDQRQFVNKWKWMYYTPICGIIYLIRKFNKILDKNIGI